MKVPVCRCGGTYELTSQGRYVWFTCADCEHETPKAKAETGAWNTTVGIQQFMFAAKRAMTQTPIPYDEVKQIVKRP
jgi:hypothetical protein